MSVVPPITSVETVAEDPVKIAMLRYINMILLTEIAQKIKSFPVRSFSTSNIKKLSMEMRLDLDLAISSAADRTDEKKILLITTIGEIVKVLKTRRKGKSGAGADGNLTSLDCQIQTAFEELFFSPNIDFKSAPEPAHGDDLNQVPDSIKVKNVFNRLKFDAAAIARVKNAVKDTSVTSTPVSRANAVTTPEAESAVKPGQTKLKSTSTPLAHAAQTPEAGSSVTPDQTQQKSTSSADSRPDHLSRSRRRAENDLRRRGCSAKGLKKTSQYMVNQALGANKVLGEVAAHAKKLIEEDLWDVYGKNIALLLSETYEDDLELLLRGSEILGKVYKDAVGGGSV